MNKRFKSLFRIVFGRTAFVMLFLLLQIAVLVFAVRWLGDKFHLFYGVLLLLSAVVVIYIYNAPMNSSFKMAWILPVFVLPVFGTLLYVFVQVQFQTKMLAARLKTVVKQTEGFLEQEGKVYRDLKAASLRNCHLAEYMRKQAGFPVYQNTYARYFPSGEEKFEALLHELEGAKHFIFLEYFIVERGYMWDSILAILEEKVKEGVEVRVMYDGMCSLSNLPYNYPTVLNAKHIRCKMFSPIRPVLSTHQNYRDHRKIVVIDGHTAFTGGVNLADEYINRKLRFGHWKDTAIMIKGDAVKSFTMMFLQMWSVTERGKEDYAAYLLKEPYVFTGDEAPSGFVLPYADSPMDNERVGRQVYLDIISQARKYVHIMTPYLILDDEVENALCYAAKRGIDVKIIMPHIPDKRYAYLLARTYYPELIQAGVKIYEYTPGFIHAKVFVSDDRKAVVGTINLDFRSLYLHFECAVYLYRNSAIASIERDYGETLGKCTLITLEECRKYNVFGRMAGHMLRLIAPLM